MIGNRWGNERNCGHNTPGGTGASSTTALGSRAAATCWATRPPMLCPITIGASSNSS